MMKHIYGQPQFGEDWFSYPGLYSRFVRECPDGGRIVEVGSWKGKSISYLAVEVINSGKKIRLDAVDTWAGSSEHQGDPWVRQGTLYELFLRNIEPVKHVINPIRKKSVKAAKLYKKKSIDIVFIDAAHEYEHVVEDIKSWLPKVKPGGMLAGHDWPMESVRRAVGELIGPVETTEYCWVHKLK
jgi:cephalosporin hydroxylase